MHEKLLTSFPGSEHYVPRNHSLGLAFHDTFTALMMAGLRGGGSAKELSLREHSAGATQERWNHKR
jgi:hypothetical protein